MKIVVLDDVPLLFRIGKMQGELSELTGRVIHWWVENGDTRYYLPAYVVRRGGKR